MFWKNKNLFLMFPNPSGVVVEMIASSCKKRITLTYLRSCLINGRFIQLPIYMHETISSTYNEIFLWFQYFMSLESRPWHNHVLEVLKGKRTKEKRLFRTNSTFGSYIRTFLKQKFRNRVSSFVYISLLTGFTAFRKFKLMN